MHPRLSTCGITAIVSVYLLDSAIAVAKNDDHPFPDSRDNSRPTTLKETVGMYLYFIFVCCSMLTGCIFSCVPLERNQHREFLFP